jgi:hypothetical protein
MKKIHVHNAKSPVIFVAPHGYYEDDLNTDIMTEILSMKMNANSIINVGWRRGKEANIREGVANLNSIEHCMMKPVRYDFLYPLVAMKERCIDKYGCCHIFYIHGMSNKIRHVTKEDVDIVVGYGAGEPSSHICRLGYKNACVTRLREAGLECYQGKPGGRFSAWNPDNLAQIFRSFALDQNVESLQFEIVNLRRCTIELATETALCMADALDKFLNNETKIFTHLAVPEY